LWLGESHAATRTVDGMERKGNVISATGGAKPFARTQRARCVVLSRLRSMSNFSRPRRAGGGSGMGFTLLPLHQSLSSSRLSAWSTNVHLMPRFSTSRSNDYSKNIGVNSEWKALLLNKVIVGKGKKLTKDDTSLTQPPPGYDSVSFHCPVSL
jgi:hypothetical protein